MLSRGEIKRLASESRIRPNKTLGQNFLIDKNIRDKILDSIELSAHDVVLEIGPGLGALTEGLSERAARVIAVEKDRRLCDFLRSRDFSSPVDIVEGDFLDIDVKAICRGLRKKIKVVGNLPYYISSPVVVKLLENRVLFRSACITVQREFAERVASKEGSRVYGAISCFVRFYSEPRMLFHISKNSFFPRPKVDSCFMGLYIRDKGLYLTDEKKLFKIIRTSFEKRRKTMLNSLFSSGMFASKDDLGEALTKSGIDPASRPENLSLKDFARLTETLTEGGIYGRN